MKKIDGCLAFMCGFLISTIIFCLVIYLNYLKGGI